MLGHPDLGATATLLWLALRMLRTVLKTYTGLVSFCLLNNEICSIANKVMVQLSL